MCAVGEVMSLGKTHQEALQKAIRSLEIGRDRLGFAQNVHALPLETRLERLNKQTSERQFLMYEALRKARRWRTCTAAPTLTSGSSNRSGSSSSSRRRF